MRGALSDRRWRLSYGSFRIGPGATGRLSQDLLALAPQQQTTRVYEVPGTKLSVFADAAGGSGTDGLDVLIYGWKE